METLKNGERTEPKKQVIPTDNVTVVWVSGLRDRRLYRLCIWNRLPTTRAKELGKKNRNTEINNDFRGFSK